MCLMKQPKVPAQPIVAQPGGGEATRQADTEARLRRARAGAAASILTSERGIPSTNQLGAPA